MVKVNLTELTNRIMNELNDQDLIFIKPVNAIDGKEITIMYANVSEDMLGEMAYKAVKTAIENYFAELVDYELDKKEERNEE